MLREIGCVENVRPFIEAKVKAGAKIMGLGHREYKVKDPRAVILQQLSKRLFGFGATSETETLALYEIALEVEKVGETLLSAKGVYANIDFYSGILYQRLGITPDFFTPIFAMARVVGWLAHWIEQLQDNHIFRPTEIYEGEHDQSYLAISKRGLEI